MTVRGLERVLVVGGGVGGMSAALQLRALDVAVDLIDIDPEWRATGAGLTLNGATLRVFARLGMVDAVAEAGHIHGGRQIFDGRGQLIFEAPAYAPSTDDLTAGGGILRPALHRILSDRTRDAGVNIRLGLTVSELTEIGDGVEVRFSDATTARYDLVIGADGITSLVRRLIFPSAEAAKFTGQGCWRAVFPRRDEIATTRIYVDRDLKLGFNPVSDTQMYMFLLETAEGNPWREPSEWLSMLRGRMMCVDGLPQELAAELTEQSLVNYRPLETLLLAPPWHVGRVVLLGDAAHATTPHAGYGAGLSIEDAVVLAECLGEGGKVEDALRTYEARRFDRCRTVLEGSLEVGRLEMAGAGFAEQISATLSLIEATHTPF